MQTRSNSKSKGKHHKLLGNSTFGKTHYNRLRKTDILIIKLFPYLFSSELQIEASAKKKRSQNLNNVHEELSTFVDIGFGDKPITLLQSANYIHDINPDFNVIGCEIDNHKVRNALKSLEDDRTW